MFSALPALLVWQLSKGNLVGETSIEEHIDCFPGPFPGTLRTGANIMANLLKLTVPRRLCRAWWSGEGGNGQPMGAPRSPTQSSPSKVLGKESQVTSENHPRRHGRQLPSYGPGWASSMCVSSAVSPLFKASKKRTVGALALPGTLLLLSSQLNYLHQWAGETGTGNRV